MNLDMVMQNHEVLKEAFYILLSNSSGKPPLTQDTVTPQSHKQKLNMKLCVNKCVCENVF